MLKLKLVRSPIGFNWRQKRTINALGLRKMNSEMTHEDNPVIRGMIAKVPHLLEVTNLSDGQEQSTARSK
ncbi:MAG: 50S ribosomal protein L30 [bacterium]|jgi:large subunit ribosomal protein L30